MLAQDESNRPPVSPRSRRAAILEFAALGAVLAIPVGTVIATAQPIPEPPTRSVQPAPAQVATATPSESPPSDRERRREAKKQRRDERKRHRDARKRRKRSRNAESRAPDS
jgi:hypothetical protein